MNEARKLEEKYKPKFEELDAANIFQDLRLRNKERVESSLSKLDEEKKQKVEDLIADYKKDKFTSLKDVYGKFDKWMELEDKKRIDAMLAVALCNKTPELEPLWLIIVGPSGDGKTEQVRAVRDPEEVKGHPEDADTKRISEITQNTLVSGQLGEHNDLAPKLEGKLMLIYDFATILNLPSEAKRKVWAQLRELHDGRIGKQAGSGKDVDYTLDPAPCLIACSTPDIDNQIIQQQKLGTRELLYRTGEKSIKDIDKVLDKVMENHDQMDQMREELNEVVQDFIGRRKVETDIELSNIVEKRLKAQAKRLAIMRAQGDFDRYTDELMKDVSVEVPSRLINQFKTLYICLMSLDPDYDSERALDVIGKIVESSGEPRRERIFQELIDRNETTSYQISEELKVSRKMVKRDLQVLWNLGLVERRKKDSENQNNVTIWSIKTENDVVELLTDKPLKDRIKALIERSESGRASYQKIIEEVNEENERIEKVLESMLERGELFEPIAGKLQIT